MHENYVLNLKITFLWHIVFFITPATSLISNSKLILQRSSSRHNTVMHV